MKLMTPVVAALLLIAGASASAQPSYTPRNDGRPLVALTPENGPDGSEKVLQANLASLSANSRYRIVVRSGGGIPLYDPAPMIQATQDVVEAVRKGSTVP